MDGFMLTGPAMLRNFMWTVCSDVLPTKGKLFRRHITTDPLCPICGQANETIFHILWFCPSSMAV